MDTDILGSIRVRDLALELAGKFAPEELDLFDELATAPVPDSKQRRRDDPLAFGVELAAAFAPVAMSLASKAVSFLVDELSDAVVGAGKDEVKARIRSWLGGKGGGTPPIEVPISTANALADLVKREGERLGLGANRSVAVANSMLASLQVKA